MKVESEFIRRVKYPYKIFNDVRELVQAPEALTYYPNGKRKKRWGILQDMISWMARHREVNRFYYVYGLDRKDLDRRQEVIGLPLFRYMRDHANQHIKGLNFNYVGLLRDKFVFGQFLNSLRFPTPKNIALMDKEEITWLDTMERKPLAALIENGLAMDGFCKQLTGIQGKGSFPLKIAGGKMFSRGRELSVDDVRDSMEGKYLFQETITQHPDMSRLHPASVNTIRMITFNNNGKIEVFCATQRIGTHGTSVDNWAAGGIVVGIDLETGTLRKEGLFKPGKGGLVEVHPDTGIKLEGYRIPFMKESTEMACQLHRYLYGIHSIGWDIAVTENGPVFIEGNDDWDGTIAMSLEKNFKQRFCEMYRGRVEAEKVCS